MPAFVQSIIGPMGSGKTGELLQIYNKYKIFTRVLCVKHTSDTRYGSAHYIRSHTGAQIQAHCATALLSKTLNRAIKEALEKGPVVILIDEAQFFNDAPLFVKVWEHDERLRIYFAGLESDFKRSPFPVVGKLMALSDEVKRMSSTCEPCAKNNKPFVCANFTRKKSADTREVAGFDLYEPVCRQCVLEAV